MEPIIPSQVVNQHLTNIDNLCKKMTLKQRRGDLQGIRECLQLIEGESEKITSYTHKLATALGSV